MRDNESSKYWLSVLNELKNREVKDILILCADDLTGIKEAIAAAFPKTEYQRCIVHQVRNTLKYVPDKDKKTFTIDWKTIYQAADEKKALEVLDRVNEKWTPKYPNSMKRWKDNWYAICPIFKFSATVRKVIYTTNAIESLNATYQKINRQRVYFQVIQHCWKPYIWWHLKPQKMDFHNPKLGAGLWKIEYYVWGQVTRIRTIYGIETGGNTTCSLHVYK